MAFNYFENTVLVDDWLVSFDKVPQAADKENVVRRVTKRWEEVKSDVDGLGGLKLQKPDFQSVADTLIKSGTHVNIEQRDIRREGIDRVQGGHAVARARDDAQLRRQPACGGDHHLAGGLVGQRDDQRASALERRMDSGPVPASTSASGSPFKVGAHRIR